MCCLCQDCGTEYRIDLIIPDKYWKVIRPKIIEDAGLLCGLCIMKRLELVSTYGYLHVREDDSNIHIKTD